VKLGQVPGLFFNVIGNMVGPVPHQLLIEAKDIFIHLGIEIFVKGLSIQGGNTCKKCNEQYGLE